MPSFGFKLQSMASNSSVSTECYIPECTQLTEIVTLHRKIRTCSDKCIKKIICGLNEECLRIMFLTYLKFFFLTENRKRYLQCIDNNHFDIINKAKYFVNTKRRVRNRKKRRKYSQIDDNSKNFCIKLPIQILSHIISFVDQKSRLNISKTNEILFWASNNITKHNLDGAGYHFEINKSVVNKHLINKEINDDLTRNYKSITWNNSYYRGSKNKKRHYFNKHMINILSSNSLNKFEIGTCAKSKNVMTNLERIALNNRNLKKLIVAPIRERDPQNPQQIDILKLNDSAQNIHKLTHIKSSMNGSLCLWMNESQFNNDWRNRNNKFNDIEFDIDKINIKQYLIKYSNIKHISFHFHDEGFSRYFPYGSDPHPIFWLWNIPNLESCSLRVSINSHTTFKQHIDKMLSYKIVCDKAKSQIKFKKLIVLFDSLRFKSISTFIKCIRKIYPNLTSLIIYQLYPIIGNVKSVDFDWKLLFGNLKLIELELHSIKYGSSFVKEIVESNIHFQNLEVLNLSKMRPQCINEHENNDDDNDNYIIDDNINDFIVNICKLLQIYGAKKLHSLNIDLSTRDKCLHKSLCKTYFKPYKLLLDKLLKSIKDDDENSKYTFDGYLRLNIPIFGKIYNENIRYKRHWKDGTYLWNQENIAQSFEITNRICRIQHYLHDLNRRNSSQIKLILDLPGFQFYKRHKKFIRFWCNYKDISDIKANNLFVLK